MNRFWFKGASCISEDAIEIRCLVPYDWFGKNEIYYWEGSIRIVR